MFQPLMLCFGLASCLLTAWLVSRLQVTDRKEPKLAIIARLAGYIPWLIKEIVISNIDVAKRIWQKDMPISPTIATVQASQKTALGLVIHANSITLTPGTLSIDVEDGAIEVHALVADSLEPLHEGDMDRRVAKLEGAI